MANFTHFIMTTQPIASYVNTSSLNNNISFIKDLTCPNRLEKLSEFADAVCGKLYDNIPFLQNQFNHPSAQLETLDIAQWNICSYGNCAYLALHAPSPYREKSLAILNKALAEVYGLQYVMTLPQEILP